MNRTTGFTLTEANDEFIQSIIISNATAKTEQIENKAVNIMEVINVG